MSFAARDFQSTLSDLLATYLATGNDLTDLRVGSILHSLLAAVAMVAVRTSEDLALLVQQGQATAAYTAFGFGTQPAQAAYGAVTAACVPAIGADIVIPLGTLFGVPGTTVQFVSTSVVTLLAGTTTIDVPVLANSVGTVGNVGVGAITQLISPIPGLTGVTNGRPFTTGRDAQTDGARRQAFRDYLATLHRGTKQSLVVGAAGAQLVDAYGIPIEQVTKVQVTEVGGGATVTIYGLEEPASSALVAQCQAVIDGSYSGGIEVPGYKAAGTVVTVIAAAVVPVVVQVLVQLAPGYTLPLVAPLVIDAVTTIFNRLDIGADLPLSLLSTAIGNVTGVATFVLQSPAFNLYATAPAIGTTVNPAGTAASLFTLVPFLASGQTAVSTSSWVGAL